MIQSFHNAECRWHRPRATHDRMMLERRPQAHASRIMTLWGVFLMALSFPPMSCDRRSRVGVSSPGRCRAGPRAAAGNGCSDQGGAAIGFLRLACCRRPPPSFGRRKDDDERDLEKEAGGARPHQIFLAFFFALFSTFHGFVRFRERVGLGRLEYLGSLFVEGFQLL